MKTFLKVVLIVLAVLIGLKLLPLALGVAALLIGAVLLVCVAGLSALAGVVCLAVVLAAVLSPLWLPIAAIVGLVALVRRSRRVTA